MRQSIPSSSMASWAAVTANFPSVGDGQTNRTDLIMGKHVCCDLDVFKRLDHKAALKFLKKTMNVT
jgi:hypothetical protein